MSVQFQPFHLHPAGSTVGRPVSRHRHTGDEPGAHCTYGQRCSTPISRLSLNACTILKQAAVINGESPDDRIGILQSMKVFVSSLIANFAPFRQAARTAITTLRHDPVMAEDFGAQPNSPQVACLQGLRQSDVVVLVLGEQYGAKQDTSGLSATHEEYREAKGRKPVIAFVQGGITPDADQAAFIFEVQGWEGGLYRGGFHDAADLQQGVTRALHDYELTKATGPVDADALIKRACDLLPQTDRAAAAIPHHQ